MGPLAGQASPFTFFSSDSLSVRQTLNKVTESTGFPTYRASICGRGESRTQDIGIAASPKLLSEYDIPSECKQPMAFNGPFVI
ncbi:hypothetical protein H920_14660 [Fukomys damarensis]|uniref:Uncharacterized protein n=1 Tax=Fukomys damarensis TaxID=885580 RepID=A0A091CW84_FUKDA|nr:hypothetical protein H920_14660 [Fukomys damarensis]